MFLLKLIYDVGNGGGTFKLFCSNPEELSDKKLEQLKSIGIIIPPDRLVTKPSANMHGMTFII